MVSHCSKSGGNLSPAPCQLLSTQFGNYIVLPPFLNRIHFGVEKSALWNHLVSIHSLIYLRNTGSSVDFFDLFQKGITA